VFFSELELNFEFLLNNNHTFRFTTCVPINWDGR